jgi:putative transposase
VERSRNHRRHVSIDHIHLVLFIPPKYAVSEVMGTIKGRVAIRMFKDVPEFRNKYWDRWFWSRGYFVSIMGVDERIIQQYVQKQEMKERQVDINGGRKVRRYEGRLKSVAP